MEWGVVSITKKILENEVGCCFNHKENLREYSNQLY